MGARPDLVRVDLGGREARYYNPTSSDLGASEFRRWWAKHSMYATLRNQIQETAFLRPTRPLCPVRYCHAACLVWYRPVALCLLARGTELCSTDLASSGTDSASSGTERGYGATRAKAPPHSFGPAPLSDLPEQTRREQARGTVHASSCPRFP
eukprot:3819720-Rhodomonas_salina.6